MPDAPTSGGLKKTLSRVLLVLAGSILGLGTSEIASRYFLFSSADRAGGAQSLYRSQQAVDFGNYEANHPGCRWEDSLVAHPYLGFVHHSSPPCGIDSSKEGFQYAPDMPRYKDPHFFTILIVGTSVAEQLASLRPPGGALFIEEVLNRDFISPNGKPFRILSGAVGATDRPAANASSLLYGDLADGIISIDGYNETNASKTGGSLMYPSNIYSRLIRLPSSRNGVLRAALASEIRDLFRTTPFLRRSFLGFIFQRELVAGLLRQDQAHALDDLPDYYRQYYRPPGESLQQALLWNRRKYEEFIRANDAVARSMNVRYAHFLQPIPAFKKHLTESEKAAPLMTTQAEYRNFIAAVQDLKKEKFPAFSLVNIFSDVQETIYVDSVHCKTFENGDNPGYRIMAEEIGKRLVSVWGLKRKARAGS